MWRTSQTPSLPALLVITALLCSVFIYAAYEAYQLSMPDLNNSINFRPPWVDKLLQGVTALLLVLLIAVAVKRTHSSAFSAPAGTETMRLPKRARANFDGIMLIAFPNRQRYFAFEDGYQPSLRWRPIAHQKPIASLARAIVRSKPSRSRFPGTPRALPAICG